MNDVSFWVSVWFFFLKQKTAYEMRISDWSSDVCSSDLVGWIFEARAPRDDAIPLRVDRRARHRWRRDAAREAGEIGLRPLAAVGERSYERRVGQECVRTCRSRWSPYH